MAKKVNKGRKQKVNIDRRKLDQYQEEIGKELGLEGKINTARKAPKIRPPKDF